jgi:hypothetical protein
MRCQGQISVAVSGWLHRFRYDGNVHDLEGGSTRCHCLWRYRFHHAPERAAGAGLPPRRPLASRSSPARAWPADVVEGRMDYASRDWGRRAPSRVSCPRLAVQEIHSACHGCQASSSLRTRSAPIASSSVGSRGPVSVPTSRRYSKLKNSRCATLSSAVGGASSGSPADNLGTP